MNKWIKIGALVLAITFLMTAIGGYTWTWPTLAFSLAIVAGLAYFGVFGLGSGFKKNNLMYIGIGAFVVAFVIGGLNIGGFSFEGLSAGSLWGTGTVAPVPGTIQAPQSGAACPVSAELYGKTATVTLNAYDQESDTPYSGTVGATAYVYNNGHMIATRSTKSAAITSGIAVGDLVSVYGGNSSSTISAGHYYLDPVIGVCVDKQEMPIEIDAHLRASPDDMQITCYDSDGNACSGGTNASQEDYDITLGANEQESFELKFKTNKQNVAFNVFGLATLTVGDIDKCYPNSGQGFTEQIVADALDVIITTDNGDGVDGTQNVTTGWDNVWTLATPNMLSEWESVKWEFIIEAGSTDPANSQTPQTSDICAVVFLDAQYHRGSDGKMYLDYYVHNEDEGMAGIRENITRPLGKQTGTIIEGI